MNEGPDAIHGRELTLGPQRREARNVEIESHDDETRSIRLAFSSEYPVDRGWGLEILSHERGAPDFSRLEQGAAVLLNHDIREHHGVTSDPELGADRRARVTARFGSSPAAEQAYKDVRDGIRKGVSFLYRIDKAREIEPLPAEEVEAGEVEMGWHGPRAKSSAEPKRRFLVTRWQPMEITFASIPADPTVGAGRGYASEYGQLAARAVAVDWREADEQPPGDGHEETREDELSEKGTDPAQESRTTVVEKEVDVDAIRREGAEAEGKRIAEIRTWQEKYRDVPGIDDLAKNAVERGTDPEQFRLAILDAMPAAEAVRSQAENDAGMGALGLSEKEIRRFSCQKMLTAIGRGDWSKFAPFEKEVSDAYTEQRGEPPQGGWVPPDVLATWGNVPGFRSPVTAMRTPVLKSGSGGNIVGTELLASSFVDILYNRLILLQLGAMLIDGLVGDVDFPKRTAGTVVTWVGEDGQQTEDTTTTFVATTRSPHTMAADIPASRRMLLQSTPSIEGLLRSNVTNAIAVEFESVAIEADGTSNKPTGILETTGIGAADIGTNGGTITWGAVLDNEQEVAIDNADFGSLNYLTNPKVRRSAKEVEKVSGSGRFIWDTRSFDAPLNGYNVGVTNNVASDRDKGTSTGVCSSLIFGNFADLLLLMWGGLDLVTDPWTDIDRGRIHVRAFQDVDVHVLRPESFSATRDITTA